ncbi:MAG TPA: rhodanese-like domain-containing protein [Solirubrobacterales bacterium]|jgi:rhodanese-related sulfurtransferase|nr:rhodanese-like domain-containing protein [Solirubrobacterales bacterium]
MDEASREVSREEARKLIEDGAQLIDVRAEHEWETGRIPGATHLPLAELAKRAGEIDKDRPVVLYCRGGNRSTMATQALADAGYDAAKLSEGIVGWAEEGLPLDPDDGYVADSGEAASILQARKKAAQS